MSKRCCNPNSNAYAYIYPTLFPRPDMCPRDVVSSVGSLLLSSAIFGTFIGPTITVILESQTKRQVQERIMRLVIPSYVVVKGVMNTEDFVAELAFLTEESLFLGVCVPVLIPLVCLSIAANSVAFNVPISHCGAECNSGKLINVDLALITAAILGYAFVVWFFFSCDLQGSWLIMFGGPICASGQTHSHACLGYLCICV